MQPMQSLKNLKRLSKMLLVKMQPLKSLVLTFYAKLFEKKSEEEKKVMKKKLSKLSTVYFD